MKKIVFSVVILMITCVNVIMAGGKGTSTAEAVAAPKILVVAPSNNVNSDYYVTDMLTEGTGICEDSVSYTYNNVIAKTLEQFASKENLVILNGCSSVSSNLLQGAELNGSGEDAMVDMSKVDKKKLQLAMQQLGASYLLVLDQHFLKYQEVPFRTMFHFVNYSLYDMNENKLGTGKSYFTSFEPQSAKDMIKSSMKSTKKMVIEISKILDK